MRAGLNIALVMMLLLMPCCILAASDLNDVKAISVSLVNQDPDPALAGDIVEIRLGVENTGGEAVKEVYTELVLEYPFELVSGYSAIQEVGTLQGYQTDGDMKIIKYKVRVDPEVTAGSYDFKVKYYEVDGLSVFQRTLSLDVSSSENAEVIYIDKTTLVPGQLDNLTFVVNNVGSSPLRELSFFWENEDDIILPVGSDNTRYINYIDVGESAELKYQVIADTNADPGLYKLTLSLSYADTATGEESEITTIAGVYVGGETDFDVAYATSSDDETSFSIANIGANPAYSVSVIIPSQDGWTVSGSSSAIIGNLNQGDYTVASFALQQSMGGSGFVPGGESMDSMENQSNQTGSWMDARVSSNTNTINVQIAYTDTMGQRKTVEYEVSLGSETSTNMTSFTDSGEMPSGMMGPGGMRRQDQSFFSKYFWPLASLVILVGVFYSYREYKKRKQKNPDFMVKDFFKRKKK